MENKRSEKNVIDFFNSISDNDKANLEKSADLLMEVFTKCVPVGDATCTRLMSSVLNGIESEHNYYCSVIELCNTIMALCCRVLSIPDPFDEED